MTRKDYVRIIEDLATAQNAVESKVGETPGVFYAVRNRTIKEVAKQFAYSERQGNPRFDEARFYAAVTKVTGIQF